jgi:hypothetical protein
LFAVINQFRLRSGYVVSCERVAPCLLDAAADVAATRGAARAAALAAVVAPYAAHARAVGAVVAEALVPALAVAMRGSSPPPLAAQREFSTYNFI